MLGGETISGPSAERPTGVRYTIVGWATIMSLLLYLDRYCISICTGYIRQDLQISQFLVEWLSFAFFITYGLFQVPSGWLTDQFGVRKMLTIFILGWSAFTGLQAFAQSFAVLAILQLLCGMAQAGAYPAGARLVRDWNPPTSRGFGSAMVALGGRVGGGIAPILTAAMMVLFVPATVNSLIEPRTEVSAPALAKKLIPPYTGLSAKRWDYIWQQLGPSEQALIQNLAVAFDDKQPATAEQTQQVRELLNRMIENPDFYRPELFDEVIETEGRRVSQERQAGATLTSPQLHRLNRLALEATFPKLVGNVYVDGWRPSMAVYGVVGVVIAALFWLLVRDTPAEDRRTNQAERDLIAVGNPSKADQASAPRESFPWRPLLLEWSMWGNCLLQITTNIGWLFLVRTMPRYLEEVHQVPLVMRGVMTSVPIWAGVVGVFYGGRLADRLVQRIGLKWGRRLPVVITRFTGALGYAICIALSFLVPKEQAPSWMPWVYVASLSLIAISTDIAVPSVWAFAQDVGGKYTASILGWGNMWGNLGAAVATPFYAAMLGKSAGLYEWNVLFASLGGIFMLGALGAVVMDPTRPLTVAREPAAANN